MACLGAILQKDNAAFAQQQIPSFLVVQSFAFCQRTNVFK
jgi:hypothetical protein